MIIDKIMELLGYININKIKIQDSFIKHPPRGGKMRYKIEYKLANGEFEQPIVINAQGYLVDGYTTYLLAKALNKKYMPVEMI